MCNISFPDTSIAVVSTIVFSVQKYSVHMRTHPAVPRFAPTTVQLQVLTTLHRSQLNLVLWCIMAKPHSGIVRSDSRPPINFTPLTHCAPRLGRVVILRSSGARVFRPIDSLARRQNVTFSNLWVRVETGVQCTQSQNGTRLTQHTSRNRTASNTSTCVTPCIHAIHILSTKVSSTVNVK
jgi:hypothetical protein